MKRVLAKALVFLLIGTILSVATAWAVLLRPPMSPQRYLSRGAAWPAGTPAQWPLADSESETVGRGFQLLTFSASENLSSSLSSYPVHVRGHSASILRCGLPWPALTSRQWAITDTATSRVRAPLDERLTPWEAGLSVPRKNMITGVLSQPRLPIRPIWPGFALNAALFGLLVAALWHVPRPIRRRFRVRCGLCAACGYACTGAAVCPECGRRMMLRAAPPCPPQPLPRGSIGFRWMCLAAALFTGALMWATSVRGVDFKTRSGWFAGLWGGQLAVGRAGQPFLDPGLKLQRFGAPFKLGIAWRTGPAGWRLSVPLWPPLAAAGAVALAAWWRSAVRRGIARHWPAVSEPSPPPPRGRL